MKVCHLTSVHKPDDTRIFHKECCSLSKAGYDTYLVVCGESAERNGVHIIGTGAQSKSRFSRMLSDTRRVYRAALSVDADIYHIHDPELLPYALKLKKHGKHVIFDSHELYSRTFAAKKYIPKFLKGVVTHMYTAYESKTVRKLDAVIFPCTIQGKHPFEGKCRITEFVDNYPIIDYDEKINHVSDGNTACYIGSLTEARGITVIVRAAKLAGAKLILAGTFAPHDYMSAVMSMPEADAVEYLGQLPHDMMNSTLTRCDIGLCLLQNIGQYAVAENFATKVFEYWIAGLPVIISDFPFNRKNMDEINGGICVDPADAQAIADAITYLSQHPDEARIMGENGRRAVLEHYNWQHEEKKLLKLYARIAEEQ